MFYIKKCIAICLSIAMVMCSTLPSLASGNDALQETTESKIVEQSKEDLGEERANEVLNAYEETCNEDVGDDILSSHEEEPEETETSMSELSEPEEDEKSTEEISESEEDKTNVDESYDGNLDKNIETSSELDDECEVIELDVEKENSVDSLLGAGEPRMWYYLTDDGTVLHITGSEPDVSLNARSSTGDIGSRLNTTQRNKIIRVIFDDVATPQTTYRMFYGLKNLTTIDNINNLDISNVNSMSEMFRGCNSLVSIDVSGFNTSNVIYMGNLFYDCESLTSLDVSGFDTSNVTGMNNMFHGCKSLTSLNVNNFNTSNVTAIGGMFSHCENITSLDVSAFDTRNVIGMGLMFSNCKSLTILDVSGFNTGNVTDMAAMFNECESLTSLDVSNLNTSNVTDMTNMFCGCSSLINLDVSNFDTRNVTRMGGMFENCSSLTDLDVSGFDTSNVTDMQSMFKGNSLNGIIGLNNLDTSNVTVMFAMFANCSSNIIDVSGFNTSSVTNMECMFEDCTSLTSLDLSNFNTSNVTEMDLMFSGCSSLTNIDVNSFDTRNVTSMRRMFSYCSSLTDLDVSNFDTSNVTSMVGMFYGCSLLTRLDLSHFDTRNVEAMSYYDSTYGMFTNCSSLVTIYASEFFDVSSVTLSNMMFVGCDALIGGNGTAYDSHHTDKEYARVDAVGTPGYFTLGSGNPPTPSKVLTSITVNNAPAKVKYKVGESFDPTGLKINLNYSDSSTDTVTYNSTTSANFTFNPSLTTALTASNTYVTITYSGKTCNQDVEVIAPQSITVKTAPSKVKYAIGETFNPTGLKINLIYSDTTTIEEVAYAGNETNFSFNPSGALNTAGASIPITITYTKNGDNFDCIQNVEVVELSSIAITTHATKLSYNAGETFDPTGLVITLTYSDSSTERVIYNATTSSSFTFSPNGPLTRTGNVITVTYAGKTTTETLNVKELTGITVATNPTKLSYATGQSLNPAGLVLTLTYTDSNNANTTENVTYNSTTQSKFTFNPSGTAITTGNVSVTYDGKTGASMQPTFAITVRTVASISVINRPSKTSYSSGNKLSPSGLSIKVNYTDGTNEIVAYSSSNSGDFSFNPSTSTSLNTGHANVTVTYGGKSTTFAISVTKKGGGYVPSSGSGNNGGGGGGGGGGIPAGTNPQNNAPATTQVASSKSISGVANSSTSTWTSDPATGKWKLNVTFGDGQVAPATNGFFMLTNTVTEVVNNVPIQTQVNNTYYFDAQGNMVTGWVQTADNKWFFFDNAKTADEGKMSLGWKQVQGSWYYFTPDGSMMENGITPDGFSIGADGKWVG